MEYTQAEGIWCLYMITFVVCSTSTKLFLEVPTANGTVPHNSLPISLEMCNGTVINTNFGFVYETTSPSEGPQIVSVQPSSYLTRFNASCVILSIIEFFRCSAHSRAFEYSKKYSFSHITSTVVIISVVKRRNENEGDGEESGCCCCCATSWATDIYNVSQYHGYFTGELTSPITNLTAFTHACTLAMGIWGREEVERKNNPYPFPERFFRPLMPPIAFDFCSYELKTDFDEVLLHFNSPNRFTFGTGWLSGSIPANLCVTLFHKS